ncbi:MAG: hypothetical protein ABH950_02260 [Candidatus Altiarchaeota archaeon]
MGNLTKKAYVYDTSVILRCTSLEIDGICLIPDKVFGEIKDWQIKELVEAGIREKKIRVLQPEDVFVEKVKGASQKTGDYQALSDADQGVLALALQEKAVVVSDDYAIQNTAKFLRLEFHPVSQVGIQSMWNWRNVCGGCRKLYGSDVSGHCMVCGAEIVRKKVKGPVKGKGV